MAHKEKLVRRKRKSVKTHNIYFIVALLFASFLTYTTSPQSASKKILEESKKKNNVVFVRQYSDSHITENAKNTDVRYKNITFSDKASLLGNVISSLKSNDSIPKNLGDESGTWLWTPVLDISPKYIDEIVSGAKRNGVKNIYLSIDSYLDIYVLPDGEEKEEKKKKFNEIVYTVVQKAYENSMTVDAEAGWRNWAEIGNSYKAFITLNFAIEFNKRHDLKLRGFQYDVEPYLLDYFDDEKKTVMGNFINLIDESVARLDGSDLLLSVVIPEFYDGTFDVTPKIFYAGQTLFPIEQLLRVLDKREGSSIIVMSYRNFSRGENGSIDISKDEISIAKGYKTKIIIAQETGNVEPSYITFFDTTKSHYKRQVGYLTDTFKDVTSFGGIATHYVNSFITLR